MSHIRKLFYSSELDHQSSPVSVSAVSVPKAGQDAIAAGTGTPPAGVLGPPDFEVEEANLLPQSRLVFHDDPRSMASNRFRLLRMRLNELWSAGKLKKLLITGPLAHEGKSTVALNLATALSERGKRTVLVVDGDMHHSSLVAKLNLDPWVGLNECLLDNLNPLSAIRRINPLGFHLMPAGKARGNPTELLQSLAFAGLLQKLTPYFDWVLVDSPPAVLLPDALSMMQHMDGTVVVIRAGKTPREALEQTVTLLGKTNIISIVLNGVMHRDHSYSQYYTSKYYRAGTSNRND